MPSNLEIKVRISSVANARQIARNLPARCVKQLQQTDTYFNVSDGRLKLREFGRKKAELIEYERAEATNKRVSRFVIYPCHDPSPVKAILKESLGIIGVVKKKRDLFLYKSTRIHIDEVKGLGAFMEFETPVKSSLKDAHKKTEHLIREFGIRARDYFRGSYIDLLVEKKAQKPQK